MLKNTTRCNQNYKNNKSPVDDRIEAELLMSGGKIYQYNRISLYTTATDKGKDAQD